VRELKNVMERAPFLCAGNPVTAEHIPRDAAAEDELFPEEEERTEVFVPAHAPVRSNPVGGLGPAGGSTSDDAERARITQALEQCAGNQTRAARLLGVSRRTLINHLERLNMPRPKKL
jgi:two-component system, NtrC family, response regulator AtoC